jgi:hypothetical protein
MPAAMRITNQPAACENFSISLMIPPADTRLERKISVTQVDRF